MLMYTFTTFCYCSCFMNLSHSMVSFSLSLNSFSFINSSKAGLLPMKSVSLCLAGNFLCCFPLLHFERVVLLDIEFLVDSHSPSPLAWRRMGKWFLVPHCHLSDNFSFIFPHIAVFFLPLTPLYCDFCFLFSVILSILLLNLCDFNIHIDNPSDTVHSFCELSHNDFTFHPTLAKVLP